MHAVIEMDPSAKPPTFTLIDLGNEPGSKVNDARINKARITEGDTLTFGNTNVVFLGAVPADSIIQLRKQVQDLETQSLIKKLMESTGCSESQAREMLDNLNQRADNVRWIYADGKVKRIRLIGQKVELPDGSRHLAKDIGGFEELEQFESEWDALEYALALEQKRLEEAEQRVEALREELKSRPATHGWRDPC